MIYLCLNVLVVGTRRGVNASASEQLGDIGSVEQVALVAELAVDLDSATMLHRQVLRILKAQAHQGIARALAGAAAMETQRLRIEQAHFLFMVQAVQDGFVVQAQQLFSGQGTGQGSEAAPAL